MPCLVDPNFSPSAAQSRLEPIIGGTLALLTHYARMPNLAAADKIARNLALIAGIRTHRPRCRPCARGCSPTGWPRRGAGCAARRRVARRLADAVGHAVKRCDARA